VGAEKGDRDGRGPSGLPFWSLRPDADPAGRQARSTVPQTDPGGFSTELFGAISARSGAGGDVCDGGFDRK